MNKKETALAGAESQKSTAFTLLSVWSKSQVPPGTKNPYAEVKNPNFSEVQSVRKWWHGLPDEAKDYYNSLETQTSIPLLEAIEIFTDNRGDLKTKLDDLTETEVRLESLFNLKLQACKRTYRALDSNSQYYWTYYKTYNTANRLSKIRIEKNRIETAVRLMGDPDKGQAWEIRKLSAKEVPLEALYQGKLRKSGKNFVGLCPFHQEKTPSFHINTRTNTFKCYGCNESGDSISFMQKKESLKFADAVRGLS